MAKRCCWGKCGADSRFPERARGLRFVPLPEAREERLLWMRLCGWPHDQYASEGPAEGERRLFVCSRHFVDGAPTLANPIPVAAGAKGDSALHLPATAPSDGAGSHSVAVVTIKEEPQEYDVHPRMTFQVDGETQTSRRIKQEVTDIGFAGDLYHEESSPSAAAETPASTSSSESEDEASDPGEMAVVTVKEEMDYDSDEREGGLRGTANSQAERSDAARRAAALWPVDGGQTGCGRQHPAETRHGEPAEGLYICSDCGKDFFGEAELEAHQRVHRVDGGKSDGGSSGGEQLAPQPQTVSDEAKMPFRCTHCDKSFARKGQLNRHEFIHSGLKPFSCSDCGKCFGNKWQLSAHQKIHSGEKPFSCTFCDKCFIRKGELTVHLKRHTGDKPFNCSFCGKCFTTKGEVNIHQRRHVGDKTLGLSPS
ncbi:zinc finger protein 300-like [Scleropages formosus]|uniref:Zinc finger protein 300-like n=1 Tax=Scleropages formosus TaxID=113540 RepID=A0A8C9VVK8_SCLFO|nr:zinc finger protein 300-like [Scleropages formosus]